MPTTWAIDVIKFITYLDFSLAKSLINVNNETYSND